MEGKEPFMKSRLSGLLLLVIFIIWMTPVFLLSEDGQVPVDPRDPRLNQGSKEKAEGEPKD